MAGVLYIRSLIEHLPKFSGALAQLDQQPDFVDRAGVRMVFPIRASGVKEYFRATRTGKIPDRAAAIGTIPAPEMGFTAGSMGWDGHYLDSF